MVAKLNFRLIIFFLIFFKLQGALNSQDIMKDLNISINQALESYKSKKLKIIDIRTHKEWKMTGIIPFVLLQFLGLVLVIKFPDIALWLPGLILD